METHINHSTDIDPTDYTADIIHTVEPYDEMNFSSLSFDSYDDWRSTKRQLEYLLAYLDKERIETQKKLVEKPGESFVFNIFNSKPNALFTYNMFVLHINRRFEGVEIADEVD